MTTTTLSTTVGELMTREPVALAPQDSVALAARLMDELNVGALPVCENWEVRGLLTDRDITVRVIAAGLDPALTPTEDVMTDRVRCASMRQSVAEVLATMGAVQIRRLPVLDDHGRLVGMVTLGDLAAQAVPGVAEALRDISTPSVPDRPAPAAAAAPEPALA